MRLGRLEDAHRNLENALSTLPADDLRSQATAMGNLGGVARSRGQLQEAERYFTNAITAFGKDERGVAFIRTHQAALATLESRWLEAEAHCAAALPVHEACGDLVAVAFTLQTRAELFLHLDRLAEAEQTLELALRMNPQLEEKGSGLGVAFAHLAEVKSRRGEDAAPIVRKAVDHLAPPSAEGVDVAAAWALASLASLTAANDPQRAGQMLTLGFEKIGSIYYPVERLRLWCVRARLLKALGDHTGTAEANEEAAGLRSQVDLSEASWLHHLWTQSSGL